MLIEVGKLSILFPPVSEKAVVPMLFLFLVYLSDQVLVSTLGGCHLQSYYIEVLIFSPSIVGVVL